MSNYSVFQKKYQNWPKRLKDAIGRKVALVGSMETKGGERFKEGLVMTVESVHRGALDLRTAGVPYGAPGSWIRRVSLRDVRLLPR